MSSFKERSRGFYAYCLVAVSMTVVLVLSICFDQSERFCLPPNSAVTKIQKSFFKVSSDDAALRIVGGDLAEPGEYPYLVSLQIDMSHFCGGSLISRRHVLTAAHCLVPFRPTSITAVVGTNKLGEGTRYYVEALTLHPSYNEDFWGNKGNDIGVVRLEDEVNLSLEVKPIALPRRGQKKFNLYHGRKLDVSGFGLTETEGDVAHHLQKLTIYACSMEICEYHWGDVRSKGFFCAILGVGFGACQGDSGGPVTTNNKEFLIGVVVGGDSSGCGKGKKPDLFAYVPAYLDFIEKEMRK